MLKLDEVFFFLFRIGGLTLGLTYARPKHSTTELYYQEATVDRPCTKVESDQTKAALNCMW